MNNFGVAEPAETGRTDTKIKADESEEIRIDTRAYKKRGGKIHRIKSGARTSYAHDVRNGCYNRS